MLAIFPSVLFLISKTPTVGISSLMFQELLLPPTGDLSTSLSEGDDGVAILHFLMFRHDLKFKSRVAILPRRKINVIHTPKGRLIW
jgi:hypothetical protein